jgi:hypothetical protein
LRGLFQYGDLHLGHCFGFSVRGVHVLPHRWHVNLGSSGMASTGVRVHVFFCCVIFSIPLCVMIIIH